MDSTWKLHLYLARNSAAFGHTYANRLGGAKEVSRGRSDLLNRASTLHDSGLGPEKLSDCLGYLVWLILNHPRWGIRLLVHHRACLPNVVTD